MFSTTEVWLFQLLTGEITKPFLLCTYLRERRLTGESGSADVVEFLECDFEFSVVIHLMCTNAHV